MSLIDQMRNQANTVKEAQEHEQQKAAKREQVYRQVIVPKLTGIVSYFSELFDHLNLVRPDIKKTYKINGVGEFVDMKQGHYLATADSNTNTKMVKISYECTGDLPLSVTLSGKRTCSDQVRYMLENNLRFKHKVIPGNFGRDEQVEYTVEPLIPIVIAFEADIENSVIHMSCINHEGVGSWRRVVKPDDIDEAFCDELGRFIIREVDSFRSTQLSDDIRSQLAAKVEEERASRQKELDKAVERMMAEEAQTKAQKPSGVFGLFKKTLNK